MNGKMAAWFTGADRNIFLCKKRAAPCLQLMTFFKRHQQENIFPAPLIYPIGEIAEVWHIIVQS
ncbi:hypothetical protein DXN05_13520 [Deminuibacter soli]|uniref:Uncharacterized protein n=1 Tax=Deminuibacter soli TaxID=2291815 RepID=A0A3E1NIG8_9BACT|nr:hypothetical protein DXN05_13520 [Deminuibacter soli]